MSPKPQTAPDEVIAQVTAAVAAQLQELQISLDSKYASLDARYTTLTSAITEQNSSIHDLHVQLSDWSSFASALERRFGPSSYFNLEAALFKLKQTSSVAHYRGEFEKLANQVDGLSSTSVLNCFLGGLSPQIQREMSTLKPQNLSEAGDCAVLIKEKLVDSSFSASYPVAAYSRAPPPKPTLTLP
ncbi:Retrotransposon gag protein [Corchorus olitorius]|uniref:Retrotransposon gag protein n=1 Tax=Corchorus olitorius TaxID=93759 RepID=A0A1R3GC83_9ROSI|nr:Retrotransposon gag protein [Corchorus olitorius]